uniref:LamG-like jellyroll fold domain-containing protein n=1 Tax=viral metagenome TaxID=1070528 RepID=A0A6C0F090_9ZZZZ
MTTPQKSFSVVNNNGSIKFDNLANYRSVGSSYIIDSNTYYKLGVANDIDIEAYTGNLTIVADTQSIILNSNANLANAIIIEASNTNGGILQKAGKGGINLLTSNGDIDILSQGSNINIGVSSTGTSGPQQTQNINLESFNNFNVNSGDIYFVSSDVISFVSNTGDIQFGTSSNGVPIIKFENGNLLVNQNTSPLDYQLDVAITQPSMSKDGYNGIMVNSKASNVAAEITLQSSNTIADGTQCILSMGTFGLNNDKASFKQYLVFQVGNLVYPLEIPKYSPNIVGNIYNDFNYSDVGRQIYFPYRDQLNTIVSIGSIVTSSSDSSNITVSGTYSGTVSTIYLLQIDSIGTPNTFMWSNNGGVTFQGIYVPILDTVTPIPLDSNISVTFSRTTGFSYQQQFTFESKISAIVDIPYEGLPVAEPMYSLQPFHSYIETTTPSDIVIKTNSSEKMRITGDGAIGIQKKIPNACLDLDSNYNKVLLVNQNLIFGYQINPSISYLESGGYVLVWNNYNSESTIPNFDVFGQRYLSDGTRYGTNFQINKTDTISDTESFPSVAGNKIQDSNHYIVSWTSYNSNTSLYNIYCQIYHNNLPIRDYDIQLNTPTLTQNLYYTKASGLYNGNYIVVWSENDGSGENSIYGVIISDNATIIKSKFYITDPSPTLSSNYPYVAGLPSDDSYYPDGFVCAYMRAIDATPDPRYTIAVAVFDSSNVSISSGEIPITEAGNQTFSSISDGLVSVCEINTHNIGLGNPNGGFVISFYRSYEADTALYNVGDPVIGGTSGATASIAAVYSDIKTITVGNLSNRLLVAEEINIISSNASVGNVVEKIATIDFINSTTANITLDIGSKSVVAYRYNSNISIATASSPLWNVEVNTTPLYADLERFNNSSNSSIYQYKRPLAAVSVDNQGTALVTWSNGSIPSIYYGLIDVFTGNMVSSEQRLTSQFDGLKQRNQVVTHLQSIAGNDYGFVISWDNKSINLGSNTSVLTGVGVFQQMIGYNHSLLSVEDGNSNLVFNHNNQLGIGTINPISGLHVKSTLSNRYDDPANPSTITIQNTSQHVITNTPLQCIQFLDGSSNILNSIQSVNSLRYDDLYPQPTNLVGFYKFDQTQGTQAVDYSSFNSYLSNINITTYQNTNGILNNFDIENCWNPGLINNALLFNGVDNYVNVDIYADNKLPYILDTYQTLSISMWINVPSNIVPGTIYDIITNKGDNNVGSYSLSLVDINGDGNMVLSSNVVVNGPTIISLQGVTTLNDSNWHHILLTVNLTNTSEFIVNLYVDSNIESISDTIGIISGGPLTGFSTYIGTNSDATANFFRGYMDELRFYNSILTLQEIEQLYAYGNPNFPAKASMILSPNSNATYNQSIVIDDDGKINNLSSRPLPYSILTGEITASSIDTTIYGNGTTSFTKELTVGDIIILNDQANNTSREFTIISIQDDDNAIIDRNGYDGPEATRNYLSVLRRPSIYTFFDNSDSIRGHIDNYGNMILGASKPSTMMEISGSCEFETSFFASSNVPELTITNNYPEDVLNGRQTAINFKGYDTNGPINTPGSVLLGRIETSHNSDTSDNTGIMKLSVNDGVTGLNTLVSLTSYGNIGIGGGNAGLNDPLTLLHALTLGTDQECSFLLESNSNASPIGASSVFDERSNIYFGGNHSITESSNPDIRSKVLAGISGSNDYANKVLNGRLDFLTNNDDNGNGIETRMSITSTGNVGVNILQPASTFNVAPELRLSGSNINTIVSVTYDTIYLISTITLSNNIFSTLSEEEKNMFIGGSVVIENETLTSSTIVDISATNQVIVSGDLSAYDATGNIIHVHYPGFNVNSSGLTGINTKSPGSVLSVNGSMSLPIINTSTNIILDLTNYTVISNCAIQSINVTLPTNSQILNGRIYVIKVINYSINSCYILPGTAKIDTVGGTYTIIGNYVHIQSDGTDWWIIG